jgi:hypothetical protein
MSLHVSQGDGLVIWRAGQRDTTPCDLCSPTSAANHCIALQTKWGVYCYDIHPMTVLPLATAAAQTKLPGGMEVVRVRDGTAEVAVPGQYSAQLTLVPAPRDEVTLAKYRPPGEAEPAAAAAGGLPGCPWLLFLSAARRPSPLLSHWYLSRVHCLRCCLSC